MFGSSSGFAKNVELSALDGSNGFALNGKEGGVAGWAVSSAGDVNGDRLNDLLIGDWRGDPGGNSSAGETYVVFSRRTGFAAAIELSALDGNDGFVINGIDAGAIR